jgi:hypothetical protein
MTLTGPGVRWGIPGITFARGFRRTSTGRYETISRGGERKDAFFGGLEERRESYVAKELRARK